MESNDLSHQYASEHIFCGFSRRNSQITNFENYYYGMDEGSDHTTYSEDDDDEYDETNADDVDCESTFHTAAKYQPSGRLCRRNIATRLDRNSENENTFRSRSKWKKYQYHAVARSMPIQEEEDEDTAGPSSTTTSTACNRAFSRSTTNEHELEQQQQHQHQSPHHHNNHIIIHVNDVELQYDELSFNDEEMCFDKESISENDSLLVAYDSNSISSV